MGTVGFGEIVILVMLALLVFGPERLPEMARNVGKFVGQLRREASSTIDELKRNAELDEFKSVADELRGAGSELRRSGAAVSAALPSAIPRAPGPGEPVPFDPDAP